MRKAIMYTCVILAGVFFLLGVGLVGGIEFGNSMLNIIPGLLCIGAGSFFGYVASQLLEF